MLDLPTFETMGMFYGEQSHEQLERPLELSLMRPLSFVHNQLLRSTQRL